MPAPKPSLKNIRPDALEIFTDRVEEQQLLRTLLAPGHSTNLGPKVLLTQFYGVGGVGKSTLCKRAGEIALAEFKDTVRVVATSFDDNRWKEGSGFTEVSAEICRCLVDHKIIPQFTLTLLALHGQQTGRNGEVVGGVDAGWSMAFTAMEKGADLTGIPGLGMVVKGAQWVRERSQRQTLRQRLIDLGLWPEEQYGKLNILDLEKKLPSALYYDLLQWLKGNPGQHVRLLLDGFERLQSSERREDSQRRLQELISYFAGTDERDACERFRVIIFGRNQLRWDEIYEDPTWRDYWNLHLLGGLAEADARDFLKKTRAWLASRGQAALVEALVKYEEKILDASDETMGGQRIFYPFYLNLAVELVERARQSGKELELGRAPAELQDRFFRYLEPRELRALMILALSEVFDESLFGWLAKERLIEYPQYSFHSQLRREHSYIQVVEGCESDWRFHRLMGDALHARWQSTAELKREGPALVQRLLEYYGAPLLAKYEREWTEADAEQWRRGMEIIVTQGPELGLLESEQWDELQQKKPWSVKHFRTLNARVDFGCRMLKEQERLRGAEHPETLRSINNLANLLRDKGDYAEAESFYRRALTGREKTLGSEHQHTRVTEICLAILLKLKGDYKGAEPLLRHALASDEEESGPDHPDTLGSVNNLAVVLYEQGDYSGAEPLYRRALAGREKALGPEHPDTLDSVNNLAILLKVQSDYAGAESLHRRAFSGREKTFGPGHPATLRSVHNLANLLREKGDYAGAEPLCHRALAGRETALGTEHQDTLSSLNNLADLLREKGDYAGAEPLCHRALAGMEKALGPNHPRTLTAVSSLASLLEAQGDYAGAKPLFLRALAGREKALGPDHPSTLDSVNNLASLLATQGDYAGAEPLFLRALAGYERALAPDHPDTLVSVNDLASLLTDQGDYAGAEPLYRRALAGREKALGTAHPDTLKSLNSLAELLKRSGSLAEALNLLRGYTVKSPATLTGVRYNLACYECLSLNLEEAKRLIAEEIAAKPSTRELALKNEDLKAIHEFIQLL